MIILTYRAIYLRLNLKTALPLRKDGTKTETAFVLFTIASRVEGAEEAEHRGVQDS